MTIDLARFLDLYVAETQEHLRGLNQALLDLEQGGGSEAVEEAFRAAHTIKGMSATMGYRAVSDIAHVLEDALQRMRTAREIPDATVIDTLLERTDALERAVATAVANGGEPDASLDAATIAEMDSQSLDIAAHVAAAAAARRPVDVVLPEGTEMVVRVGMRRDAQLLAARALIARRNVERNAIVIGSFPEEFGDDFDGQFRLFIGQGGDRVEIERAIRGAGDVEVVEFESPLRQQVPKASAAAATDSKRARHVRVDQRRIDDLADGIGELGVLRKRLEQMLRADGRGDLWELIERMRRIGSEVQNVALAMRMVPVADVFERFPRLVRDAARILGKEIDFSIEGKDIEIDRSVLDEIADPLVHLLRNSVDHGIEPPAVREAAGKPARGTLRVRAERGRASVHITVQDDGGGVNRARIRSRAIERGLLSDDAPEILDDAEVLRIISAPGFSTATQITEVSGRGVGMDAVLNRVRAMGGSVELQSTDGKGSTFILVLPITLALTHSLRVRIGWEDYAIPLTHVSEVIDLGPGSVSGDEREVLRVRDEEIPLIRLTLLLGVESGDEASAVIAEMGDRRTALAVDELIAKEQIVVKPFDVAAGMLPYFSGVTMLADGRPALVLDPISVS